MTTSRITLNIKTGMVIFVGIAARFVTRHIDIAQIAIIQSTKRLPERMIANNVIGVSIHP
jgi:hypothetical protein